MRSLFLLFVFLLVSALPSPVFSDPLPRIDLGETVYDFGEVYQGEKVTHVFTFANRGEAPLIIDRVKSSCGCTAALLSAKEIAPGQQGTIKTTFDSTRFQGDIHKVVMVYSNAPGNETSRYSIKGTVKPLMEAEPGRLDFGQLAIGDEGKLSFSLVNTWRQKLEIKNIRTSNVAVTARTDAVSLAPGEAAEFAVVARPVAATPHLRGYVLVRIDAMPVNEIKVPFQGYIANP